MPPLFHFLIADIGSSGSLGDCASVYLEEHMSHLSPVPEECSAPEEYGMPITLHPSLSGRLTEESGYGTHNSTQTHDCSMLTSSHCTSQEMDQVEHASQFSMRNEFLIGYESKVSVECIEENADEGQMETDGTTAVSEPVLRWKNSIHRSSTPISVPPRNASSSSLTSVVEQTAAAVATGSPPTSPPNPKHLSNKRERRSFWWRLVAAFLTPSPTDDDTVNVLPGVKLVF